MCTYSMPTNFFHPYTLECPRQRTSPTYDCYSQPWGFSSQLRQWIQCPTDMPTGHPGLEDSSSRLFLLDDFLLCQDDTACINTETEFTGTEYTQYLKGVTTKWNLSSLQVVLIHIANNDLSEHQEMRQPYVFVSGSLPQETQSTFLIHVHFHEWSAQFSFFIEV